MTIEALRLSRESFHAFLLKDASPENTPAECHDLVDSYRTIQQELKDGAQQYQQLQKLLRDLEVRLTKRSGAQESLLEILYAKAQQSPGWFDGTPEEDNNAKT